MTVATSPESFTKNVGFSTLYSTTSAPSPHTPTLPPYASLFSLSLPIAQIVVSSNAASYQAHTFFRQYVLNSNATGSITVDSNNKLTVFGGEDPNVAADAPRVASKIFLGAGVTQSTLIAPSATVAAWKNFLKGASTTGSTSGAQSHGLSWLGRFWLGVLVLCASYFASGSLI